MGLVDAQGGGVARGKEQRVRESGACCWGRRANAAGNNGLWTLRLLLFLQCATACAVCNFLVLFYHNAKGLSYQQVGVLVGGVYPLLLIVGQPLGCAVADHTRRPKAVLIFCLTVSSAGLWCLQYAEGFWQLTAVAGSAALVGGCVNPLIDSATMWTLERNNVSREDYGRYRVFGGIGWGVAAGALGPALDAWGLPTLFYAFAGLSVLFLAALLSFRLETDSSRSSSSSSHNGNASESDISRSRRAGVGNGGSDANNNNRDIDATNEYSSSSSSSPLLPAPSGPAAHHHYSEKSSNNNNNGISSSSSSSSNNSNNSNNTTALLPTNSPVHGRRRLTVRAYLAYLLRTPGVGLFFVLITLMGICKATIDVFLFLHLQTLHASHLLLGLSLVVTTFGETPFFFYAGPILRRLGTLPTVSVALYAYTARLAGYAFITNPWYILPLEPLHGVTFALSWTAVASFAAEIAPPGYGASTMGLVSAFFWGIGFSLGGIGGGVINQNFGSVFLFQCTTILAMAGATFGTVIYWCCLRKKLIRYRAQSTTSSSTAGTAATIQ